jgi:tetratricopeptide (TPR) repeat protein
MTNAPEPDSTSSPRDDTGELLRRQAEAMERLALVSDPEYVPRARAVKRLAGLIVALSGGVLAAYEFAIFVYESYQRRDMVSNWVEAARELYEVESSPEEATVMLERAAELGPQDASVVKMSAYIGGMRTVERLLNLDRPFTKDDMEQYGAAMGQAIMLQRVAADEPEWAILRGQLASAVDEPARALEFLDRALKIDPDNAFASLRLGLVHRAIASATDDKAKAAEETRNCRELIDRALALRPQFSLARLWRAYLALDADDSDAAIAECREILRTDPRFYKAYATMGQAHFMKGELGAAQAAYQRALAIRPDLAIAMYGLANIFGTESKYEIALLYARRATSTDPGYMSAWQMQGTLALELAKESGPEFEGYGELISEAIECYSKALDLDPRNADNFMERSKLYRMVGKLRQAGSDARNATLFGPMDPYAWNVLGEYLLAAGFHAEAIDAFTKTVELDQSFDAGFLGRARARRALGDLASAQRDLDAAVAVASDQIRAIIHLERGSVREALGDRDGALEDFISARTTKPENFDAWIAEAKLLKAMDRPDQSRAAAREALKLRPDDPITKELAGP